MLRLYVGLQRTLVVGMRWIDRKLVFVRQNRGRRLRYRFGRGPNIAGTLAATRHRRRFWIQQNLRAAAAAERGRQQEDGRAGFQGDDQILARRAVVCSLNTFKFNLTPDRAVRKF